ncbi:hypothetical protein FQN50_009664 [Emmonsiellopsis sp. PD_5]|nr:hypothetical protein FQN50_009664 [Emmonsiellopsis sp. PD_5]
MAAPNFESQNKHQNSARAKPEAVGVCNVKLLTVFLQISVLVSPSDLALRPNPTKWLAWRQLPNNRPHLNSPTYLTLEFADSHRWKFIDGDGLQVTVEYRIDTTFPLGRLQVV